MRQDRADNKNQNGQALVEFALILPVLLLIILGILEFGWLFNSQITVTSSAREGARVACVTDEEGKIKSAIKNHIEGLSGLTFSGSHYYVQEGTASGTDALAALISAGIPVGEVGAAVVYESEEVRVYLRAMKRPLVGLFGFGSSDLWGTAVMRLE
jgi:hypothetical protein